MQMEPELISSQHTASMLTVSQNRIHYGLRVPVISSRNGSHTHTHKDPAVINKSAVEGAHQ